MFLPKPEKPGIWAYLKRHGLEPVMREVHVIQPYVPVGPTLGEIADARDPSDEDVTGTSRLWSGTIST